MKSVLKHLAVAMVLTVACAGIAHASTWVGGGPDNEFSTTNNWNDGGINGTQDINGNFVVERVVDNIAARTFVQGGAILNVTGGTHNDSQSGASLYNFVGNNSTGTVNQSGGTYSIGHGLRIGTGNGSGVGTFNLTGGDLIVYRGSNSAIDNTNPGGRPSVEIGDNNGGLGLLELSGVSSLATRGGVHIGIEGTFSVVGSTVSSIGIGSNQSGDGSWLQTSNSTLKVAIDAGGVTPVFVDDVDGGGVFAELRDGALLDVSFLGGHLETNAWRVLNVENGPLVDNGLEFAPGVDPNWAKKIVGGQQLWVSYAGAPIPDAVTNLYVDAAVPVAMPATWNLWAPAARNHSAITNQSSSGFTATFEQVDDYYGPEGEWIPYAPRVAQEFASDLDISEVGRGVRVSFDVEMLTHIDLTDLDTDFRFCFYDTNANAQILAGMVDMATPAGATMRMRILDMISATDTNQFVPGDYGTLGLGYTTLGGSTGNPGTGLVQGVVNSFETTVARTDTNEVAVTTSWWDDSGISTATCSMVIDESSPPAQMPPDGKWDTVSGFGFMIYDYYPFLPLDLGDFRVSNFKVEYVSTSLLPGGSFRISDLVMDPSGDLTLTLLEPIVGAPYTVFIRENMLLAPDEIGTYVAEAPGTITIPAADLVPYTSDERFLAAELPVTVEIVTP